MRSTAHLIPSAALASLTLVLAACSSSSAPGNGGTTTTTTTTGSGGSGGSGWGQGGIAQGGGLPSCDAYCADAMSHCAGGFQQFPDEASCKAFCATWSIGDAAKHQGDTVACHAYHAGAPAQGDPDPHCYHAGPSGDGQCGATACDDFCAAAVQLCTGPQEVWKDEASCKTDCVGFAASGHGFSTDAKTGDTLECRLYQLTVAATHPVGHCSSVGKSSTACK